MKILRSIRVVAVLAALLAMGTAHAVPVFLGQVAKNGTGPEGGNGNDPDSNFYRLQQFLDAGAFAVDWEVVCDPIAEGHVKPSNPGDEQTGLGLFDYAVVHYGTGPDGVSGLGGGVSFYYLNGADSYTFPSSGEGPYGTGGISSIDLFRCSVPDGGMTLVMLGLGVVGLMRFRRS